MFGRRSLCLVVTQSLTQRGPPRMLLVPSSLTVSPLALPCLYRAIPFSSFDFLLKMFSVFFSSSVIKKLENTKIHQGKNNNDPNSQHSRVNDCSYFGLFILSLSFYLSCVLQYPKKCRFIPTNKLRAVGTTT